ncbi:hypothetical protein F5Y18DRAFT_194836 [Xylariaceae sp. FL1019]|nr:hypothetical protein F5Y18DRAFT_194836 [Xylariaceae sp. FL1019]
MRYIAFLLLKACFANTIKLDVGTDPGLPSCASHCMLDSMFVTQCLDMNCLCHEKDYQRTLFQCLYSQCDSLTYGNALSRTIITCIESGAEIYMVAPGPVSDEVLRAREADYLAGRQLTEVPGLALRIESAPQSVATATVTTTFTAPATATFTITVPPTSTPLAYGDGGDGDTSTTASSSLNRPWVVTQSTASRADTSYIGLVLWIAVVLLQDYWINGY